MKAKAFILFILCSYGLVLTADAVEVKSYRIESDLVLPSNITGYPWNQAKESYQITDDWQGVEAEGNWNTEVKSLWTDSSLYLLFVANYEELSVNPAIKADKNGDCWGIWDCDVVEMFIGDNPDIKKYFEFVASPIGQKIDIRHNKNHPKGKDYYTDYTSGWEIRVNNQPTLQRWMCQLKIPMTAIAVEPIVSGKKFRANFYRCTGDRYKNKDKRKYMALNATETAKPSFHVPDKFGSLMLVDEDAISQPAFHINFNGERQQINWSDGSKSDIQLSMPVKSSGIAGSGCADFWRFADRANPTPMIISDEHVAENFNGIWSMTITGWFRREADFNDLEAATKTQYLLNCPGRFHLFFDKWSRIALRMYGKDDGKLCQIWSSWFSTNHFNPGDRWVFFAITYDGTKKDHNGCVYFGSEKYPVEMDAITSAGSGQIAVSDLEEMILGAYSKNGDGILKGMIDDFRIYASNDRRENFAYAADKIEKIRRLDLKKKWLESQSLIKQNQLLEDTLEDDSIESKYWSGELNLHEVGVLQRVISTKPPKPVEFKQPFGVMRGGKANLQFAASSTVAGKNYKIRVSPLKNEFGRKLDAVVKTYHVKHVPVEANNNGGIRTSLTTRPPERWTEYQIAQAPFKAAEVLVEAEQIVLRDNSHQADLYRAILLEAIVSKNAESGVYMGKITLESLDGLKAEVPVKLRVFDLQEPDYYALHNYHWLMPEPENLQFDQSLQWWSDEHWTMLEGSMQSLRDFGQDVVNIPLLNYGPYAPIKTIKNGSSYDFDFTTFDRYFELALDKGFRTIAGTHILWLPRMGAGSVAHNRYNGVYVWDSLDAEPKMLFSEKYDQHEWLEFLPTFYKQFYLHLKQKGWAGYYIQQQYDEPSDSNLYKRLSEITRRYMPGIRTIDAIKTKPEFSPFVDIMVFDIFMLRADAQELVAKRSSEGKSSWFYHCASPYPPYPNRHLDDPLTSSCLYPYLAYMANSDGYLWWAANVYRGADPYNSSIGPLPGGSTNPGHGPGDNWMYYPGPNGLRPSMRMVAFRQGLVDHTLLKMLGDKDKAKADKIMQSIATDPINYSTNPTDYYNAHNQLLKELEEIK